MSVIQPRLQIPKMNIASPTNVPLNTNADPNIKIDGVNTLTRAAVTKIQYLSLFIFIRVPQPTQKSSPSLFATFCLWSAPGLVQYTQDRLTARVGDQGLPKLRYNVSVTESFIGDLDFPSHIYAASSQSNHHLAAFLRNQRGWKIAPPASIQ